MILMYFIVYFTIDTGDIKIAAFNDLTNEYLL